MLNILELKLPVPYFLTNPWKRESPTALSAVITASGKSTTAPITGKCFRFFWKAKYMEGRRDWVLRFKFSTIMLQCLQGSIIPIGL